MSTKSLTLQEVEVRQNRINQEVYEDKIALKAGYLDESEAVRRSVYREFEQRWLEMEAQVLKSNIFATEH